MALGVPDNLRGAIARMLCFSSFHCMRRSFMFYANPEEMTGEINLYDGSVIVKVKAFRRGDQREIDRYFSSRGVVMHSLLYVPMGYTYILFPESIKYERLSVTAMKRLSFLLRSIVDNTPLFKMSSQRLVYIPTGEIIPPSVEIPLYREANVFPNEAGNLDLFDSPYTLY